METLGIKMTFPTSGVTFEIKKDDQGNYFASLSGGNPGESFANLLAAHSMTSLDLPTTINDIQKLGRLNLLAYQIDDTL